LGTLPATPLWGWFRANRLLRGRRNSPANLCWINATVLVHLAFMDPQTLGFKVDFRDGDEAVIPGTVPTVMVYCRVVG